VVAWLLSAAATAPAMAAVLSVVDIVVSFLMV